MAVAYHGEGHVSNGGVTAASANVPVPAATPSGALMLLAVTISSTTITITPPAGWTEVSLPVVVVASEAQLRVYQRVAGGSEPSTYTVTFSSAVRFSCAIVVYTGAELGPVNSNADTVAGLSHTGAFVTPDLSGTWIATAWSCRTGSGATFGGWSPPAGEVERLEAVGTNSSVNVALAWDDSNGPVALVSQNRVATTGDVRISVEDILCIRPAGVTNHPVDPSGIPSAEAFGQTTITHTRLITSGDINGGEVMGATAVVHTRLVTSGDIPAGDAYGQTTITHTRLITSGDINGGEQFGSTTVLSGDMIVTGDINAGEIFGQTTLVHTRLITSGGIPPADEYGTTDVTHTRLITSGGISSGETMGSTVVSQVEFHDIFPAGIPSASALGQTTIRRAVAVLGCDPWPIDMTCLPAEWGTDPEAFPPDAVASIAVAQELLNRLSAGQFSLCAVKIRPCRKRCRPSMSELWRVDNLGVGFYPLLDGGRVYNIPCGCGDMCGCAPLCEIRLAGRVAEVVEVRVDGVMLPPDAYYVDMYRDLVRVDGECWPDCQDLAAPDTEPGTFSVTYKRGRPLGPAGQRALAVLATELWKGRCGRSDCRLPARVTSVVRDGVTYDLADTMEIVSADRFGITEIDAWLNAVNPVKARSRMGVWSPDMQSYRRRTS